MVGRIDCDNRRWSGSAPYKIETSSDNLTKSSATEFTLHRRGTVNIGESGILFELGEFEVDGVAIKLQPVTDTNAARHLKWDEVFRTEPFTIANASSFQCFRGFEILNRDDLNTRLGATDIIDFRVEIVDAATEVILATPDVQIIQGDLPADLQEVRNLYSRWRAVRKFTCGLLPAILSPLI